MNVEISYLNGIPCATIQDAEASYHFTKDADGEVVLTSVFALNGWRERADAPQAVWDRARQELENVEPLSE